MTARTLLAVEQTGRCLAAQRLIDNLVTDHRLPFVTACYDAGAVHLGAGEEHLFLGPARTTLTTTPAGLLAWCEYLAVDQVILHRAPDAIELRTGGLIHLDLLWHITATLPRVRSRRPSEDLPGDQVSWRQEQARVGRSRLATGLRARGLA